MNTEQEAVDFERRAQALLVASLDHTSAQVRSRLNRSRQAAVAAVGSSARPWLKWTLLPATGAACAAALALVFMLHTAPAPKPLDAANALDVIDLVTDDDAMALVENGDSSFYEWAAAQESVGGAGGGA